MSDVRICCDLYYVNKEHWPKIKEIWPELDEEKEAWSNHCADKIINIDDVPDWIHDKELKGVTIKPLKRVKFTKPTPDFNTGDKQEVKEFIKNVSQIVMPGFELLQYRSITFEEDACTNAIQDMLDDGWRILAVCPQPDQRRPDYILVHTEQGRR